MCESYPHLPAPAPHSGGFALLLRLLRDTQFGSRFPACHSLLLLPVVPLPPCQTTTGLIEENPELLLRMPYYLHDDIRLLDDLPIELQNMFVLGGKGLGYLHKYWNNRLTERDREAQWDATSTSSSMGSSSSNSPSAGGL